MLPAHAHVNTYERQARGPNVTNESDISVHARGSYVYRFGFKSLQ